MTHRHLPFKFERATEKYLETIVGLANLCFPENITAEEIKKELRDKKHRIYLAREGEKIVGFNIWHEDEDDGQIWDWLHVVHPDYRKTGIGSRLMDKVIIDARELGYSRIRLKTFDGFHSMIRFCRRKGFVKYKTKKPDVWGENKFSIYFQYNLNNGNGRSKLPVPEPKPAYSLDFLEQNSSYLIGINTELSDNLSYTIIA